MAVLGAAENKYSMIQQIALLESTHILRKDLFIPV